jgi:hypothetical protein
MCYKTGQVYLLLTLPAFCLQPAISRGMFNAENDALVKTCKTITSVKEEDRNGLRLPDFRLRGNDRKHGS